ncbi:MAG: sodium/proton-translocating pyrophosphatase, partial [Blastocatellia bacterium]|nr:sodium/proton-translocating pyrophosphatase [Blastocatellia bacterium]
MINSLKNKQLTSQLIGILAIMLVILLAPNTTWASEANIVLPDLNKDVGGMPGKTLLYGGLLVSFLGMGFGLLQMIQLKNLPVHKSMADISDLIWETCKTYLVTQVRFILILEVCIGAVMVYYFAVLQHFEIPRVVIIMLWSLIGILGSCGVAWFGIRVNTYANSRAAFGSLQGKPWPTYDVPLKAGMSIGMLLISVELLLMLIIL